MLDPQADLDAAERRIDAWQADIEKRAGRAATLSRRLAALSATARSDDGSVELSVDQAGVVTSLCLDESIRNRPAAQTAEQILSVMRLAQRLLARQASDATEETFGRDSETGRAVMASYSSRLAADPAGESHAR